MKQSQKGSVVIWIIGGIAVILFAIFVYFYFKIFLVTTGIDTNQVNTYKNAIDRANEVKSQIENHAKELNKQIEENK